MKRNLADTVGGPINPAFVVLRSLSSTRTTSPAPSCVDALRTIRSFGLTRRVSFHQTSRRWSWPLTTTIMRSSRCSCHAITPSRSRIRSPASAPTASRSRTTTRWRGHDHGSTPTVVWPVPPTWHCLVLIPSWLPSNCAKKWRNWRRLRKSSKLVNPQNLW